MRDAFDDLPGPNRVVSAGFVRWFYTSHSSGCDSTPFTRRQATTAFVIIALASPPIAQTVENGLRHVEQCLARASAQGAGIICFPEAYLPGLRGLDFDVPPFTHTLQEQTLRTVAVLARTYRIAVIMGMERYVPAGRQIVSYVINEHGTMLGCQTKNQLDPSEEASYVPGTTRALFTIGDVTFGIAICHEGWRYPETVRWAAMRGAHIVFHPQHTGSDIQANVPSAWGAMDGPYYEKAMLCRSIENTIYFASVNYGLRFQESATSLIDPSGHCQAYLPHGQSGVLVQTITPALATGLLAHRYAPERYHRRDDTS